MHSSHPHLFSNSADGGRGVGPSSEDITHHALRLRTLGTSELLVRSLSRDGAQTRAVLPRVLQVLVALGPQGVSIERLSRELWSGRASRAALDTALHRLRQSLGDERLVVLERGTVRLDLDTKCVDCWELADFCTKVAKRAQELSTAGLVRLCTDLIDLYRGAFCRDDRLPVLTQARDRFASKFVRCVELLAERLCKVGALSQACWLVEVALERERASEVLYRVSMQLSLRRGLTSEATRTLDRCTLALRSLGLEPSLETRSLVASQRRTGS